MMRLQIKQSAIVCAILCALASTAHAQQDEEPTNYLGISYGETVDAAKPRDVRNLDELLSNKISKKESKVPEIRAQALQDVAFQLGASSGLVFRMEELKKEINQNSAELDNTFDFSKLAIYNGVLPPILSESLSNYSQTSDDVVRVADKIYKIESPARFVSVYPTWRSYLLFNYTQPERPVASFLPKDGAEKEIWDEYVKKGWKSGVEQADAIFENAYARLDADYNGMLKYKLLVEQKQITPTVVASENLGVTGGGREMSINDSIFRITDHSALNPNVREWKTEYPITNRVDGVLK